MAEFSLFLATGTSTELLKTCFSNSQWDWQTRPLNVLVTFPFVKTWDKAQADLGEQWPVKRTILDSGAFSLWNSGKTVDFEALCVEAGKGRWDEAVGLDVIGDAEASLANCLKMKERGLTVMPVFHYAEPFEILAEYKKHFNRIGLSCRFGEPIKESLRWLGQCFARAYPHSFHSFGWCQEKMLTEFPFVTCDTASWHVACRFGKSFAYGGIRTPKRSEIKEGPKSSAYDLRADVLAYLALESRVKDRWATELAKMQD